jgi:uncharacterized protein YbjT (DUF2867 family)
MKTAIVIGATGLVGKQLIHLLLEDARFSKVCVFGRRSLGIQNLKLEERLIDFNKPDSWQVLVTGDILFSTLGTTLKQAGGQQAQYKIDHNYQYQFAEAAAYNDVPVYVLVSSASASPDSKIFYSRMKGELEHDVKKLPFKTINILQPSLLVGNREHARFGESFGYKALSAFNSLGLFKKYRPIQDRIVAKAMINAAINALPGVHVFSLDQIFKLAD